MVIYNYSQIVQPVHTVDTQTLYENVHVTHTTDSSLEYAKPIVQGSTHNQLFTYCVTHTIDSSLEHM